MPSADPKVDAMESSVVGEKGDHHAEKICENKDNGLVKEEQLMKVEMGRMKMPIHKIIEVMEMKEANIKRMKTLKKCFR